MYEPETQKGLFANVWLWIIGCVVVAGLIGIGLWTFGVLTADVKGRGEARKQLRSADYRIQAYDHFYNLCAAVQASEAALDAQLAELASTPQGSDDRERILANIAGVTAERARAIRQYNADARKGYTLARFRASDLPFQLGTDPYSKEAPTSCEA